MSRNGKVLEIEQPPLVERAMLVRVALPDDTEREIDESLIELANLTRTAGAEVVQTFVQHRHAPDPATLIGAGKIEEIAEVCVELNADLIIMDSELTARQASKLEKALDRKVIDRTQLILDIFAQRAQTNEGKLQVELARLHYMLPRLAGRGSIMRQQGGVGAKRGPGEQKLEMDRRLIRKRIGFLEKEIEGIRITRRVQRKKRTEAALGTVALVGYTNAGKSSLLNALAHADVLVEDKLFATLDPRSRRCTLPSQREIVLTDTVGFIRKLPHSLVAAFRATLEETVEADLLLIVADASHPAVLDHLRAVYEVLEEIGVHEKPQFVVFNKRDAADPHTVDQLLAQSPNSIAVSARSHEGLDGLLRKIDENLGPQRRRVRFRIPQGRAGLVSQIHAAGRVLEQSYDGDHILLEAEIDLALENRLAEFVA